MVILEYRLSIAGNTNVKTEANYVAAVFDIAWVFIDENSALKPNNLLNTILCRSLSPKLLVKLILCW